MSIRYGALAENEQPLALRLWDDTFKPGAGYFERYFRDDPWYREGDCFAAWDGERLAAAVHLCRRPLEWAGRTLWCAAVANVATAPEYRRRGLSRDLLRLALERMSADAMDFSMLFTGQFGHYGVLGWERTLRPKVDLHLAERLPGLDFEMAHEKGVVTLASAYWQVPPRPLLLHRPEGYYRGWVGWEWAEHRATVLGHPEAGFAAVCLPGEQTAFVIEWHAMDAAAELRLISAAAHFGKAAGKTLLRLPAIPYYGGVRSLEELGRPEVGELEHMMLRNVSMAPEEYAELRRLYASGDAVWWPSDAF